MNAERALREASGGERLRRAVESSWDMITLLDGEGRLEYASEAVERVLGWPPIEFISRSSFEYVHPEDIERTHRLHQEVLASPGRAQAAELRVRHRDGGWRWLELVARNLLDHPGVRAIVVNSRDITPLVSQRQALEAAHREALVFRQMVERASQAIGMANLEGRVLYANPAMLRLLALPSLEAARVHGYEDFYREEDLPYLRETVIRSVYERGHWTGEMPLKPLAGEPVSTIHSVYLLRDDAGAPHALANVVVDITEQKRVERSLRASEAKYRQAEAALERRVLALTRPLDASEGIAFEDLFDVADIQRLQDLLADAFGIASVILASDGSAITEPSNVPAFCRMVHATPGGRTACRRAGAELGSQDPAADLRMAPCRTAGLWHAGARIAVGGRHLATWLIGQVRVESVDETVALEQAARLGLDGAAWREAWEQVPAMPRAQFEKVARVLAAVARKLSDSAYQNVQQARFIAERDAAEARRKELEAALQQRQHELERFARLDLLNNIASGLAHELNQPIAAAQYLLSGARRMAAGAALLQTDMAQILGDAYAQVERVGHIVEQISALSRQHRAQPAPLALPALLRECLALMDFQFRCSRVALTLEVQVGLPEVNADRTRIQQSVLILLQNAVESIRARQGGGGHVTLGAARAAQAIEVRVCDDGAGFSDAALQRLFHPFYTTKEGGMGLGLSICRAIIDEYGGEMFAGNNPGQGATVGFRLPLH